MALVCFDTHFVIWGFKQEATSGQEDYIARALYVIQQCEERGDNIAIPAIVLGELLSNIPEEMRADFIRGFEQGLVVLPFDARAALVYARMWAKRKRFAEYTREETKADYMIAATAVANQCSRIYSNDEGLKAFASDHIPVVSIAEIRLPPQQLSLPDEPFQE